MSALLRNLPRAPTSSSTSLLSARRLFTTTARPQVAKMSIIGRLAGEPELSNTSTGRELVRYTVATSYGPRDDPKTSWFRVTSFEQAGPRRDYLLNVPKGTLVHVDADARLDTYEDAEGKKRSSLNLIQRSIDVLSRPRPRPEEEVEGAEAATA